jgi:mannose/cellobiose epimerase-like protein (N-acyl-D-glucosamine 2-epimerase family)
MKRRTFIGAVASASAAAATSGFAQGSRASSGKPARSTDSGFPGGLTLQGLLKEYRYWLFDDFLPFMDKYVIDHELGGFMCTVDRDGTQVNSNKSAWYEGRGIWTYSFLYNKLSHDPKHLEVARKSVDFTMKIKPSGDERWPASFQKDGTPIKGEADIYGDLFIANGLQEYAKAKGNERYWDVAKDILIRRMKTFDSPNYEYLVSYAVPPGSTPPPIKAPSVLGHWMVIINLATQMLEMKPDREVEGLAGRAVDAIMNRHFNPDFGLQNEVVNHDLSRNPDYAQFSYLGHAIETYWMVMHEAVRRKDSALWDKVIERFKRHVEVAWDDVYGGAFRALYNVDENQWAVDKVTWLQEEILIGTLFMIEHTGDQWAKDWFARMWKYAMEKLILKPYGFPLWVSSGDRKITFVRKASRSTSCRISSRSTA